MLRWLLVPIVLQAIGIAVDEAWFHRRRGLPRWERLGHPIDIATVALCYAWLVVASPENPAALPVYVALAAVSCLMVTKDEPIHARCCPPGEHWLHAVLFILHPVVFIAWGVIWWTGVAPWAIAVQLGLTVGFLVYQLVYWSLLWKP